MRILRIIAIFHPARIYSRRGKNYFLHFVFYSTTAKEVDEVQSSKLFYTLCVILYLLQTVNPRTKFKKHFNDLLEKYSIVEVGYMGFPTGWKELPLWKN
ncbi:MAG: hypothetical protein IJY54_06880 [Paludibacteraceae bacterium]|nr:hypothetical protein [Paludibacteraceae bacterium]